jgi:hypothetical protein
MITEPTSVLREMILVAEQRFGGRTTAIPAYVAYTPDHSAPFAAPCLDQNCIIVFLTEDMLTAGDEQIRLQLAHEAVHCLAPSREKAPRLEEGVATLLSLEAPGISQDYARKAEAGLPTFYKKALHDVRELLRIEPNGVFQVRQVEPDFRRLTSKLLQDVLGISPELAERLCKVE